MKFKITACIQCGHEFKITSPKKVYCRPACRSAAHRDRHGYEQPIFKYEEIRALKELREMDIRFLYNLKTDAVLMKLMKEIDKLNIELNDGESSNGINEKDIIEASSSILVHSELLSKHITIIERIQGKKPQVTPK